MSFEFKVQKIHTWFGNKKRMIVDGVVESGIILNGDCGKVNIGQEQKDIKILSIVLVNGKDYAQYSKTLSIVIEKPDFDINELIDKTIKS